MTRQHEEREERKVAAKVKWLFGRRPVVPMLLSMRQRKQWVRSLRRIGDERPALTVARTHDARRQILAEQRSHCDVDTVARCRHPVDYVNLKLLAVRCEAATPVNVTVSFASWVMTVFAPTCLVSAIAAAKFTNRA
jgi:hypothetical protein